MYPNLLLFFSFLMMYKLNEAASIPKPPMAHENCSFVGAPLDFVNLDAFRLNVKQELKRLNCTDPEFNVTEADLENPKKDSIASDNFCTSALNVSWKPSNLTLFPSLNHLKMKIFTNHTLCLVVCTEDLNETLWPYCALIRNRFEAQTAKPANAVTKPSEAEPEKKVLNQPPNGEKKAEPAVSAASPKNVAAGPADSAESQKNDAADSLPNPKTKVDEPTGEAEEVDDPLKKDGLVDNAGGATVDETLNDAPVKTENTPDSSKKTAQQGAVNASNQFGKPSAVDAPSKSLPRTAIVTGAANLRRENDESHYFIYFVVMSILCILCYVGIYNKKKILALVIEGRKQKDRRRHASAGYRKLNTNLEEVMPLGTSAPATDSMIY